MNPFLLKVACISIKINEIPIGRKNILPPFSYLDVLRGYLTGIILSESGRETQLLNSSVNTFSSFQI